MANGSRPELLITPRQSSLASFIRELVEHRGLLVFLVWKNIKVQFAQMVLGFGWLILRPTINVVTLTLVFGKLAKLPSDGQPYALFAFAGTVIWNYFSNVTSGASMSMVSNASLLTKIYFPRIYLPCSIAIGGLLDFGITLGLFLVCAGLIYGRWPGVEFLFLPVPLLLTIMSSMGLGLWLATLAVDFRDVRNVSTYLMQLLMFAAPVVWPVSLVAERLGEGFLPLYALYPMVGAIEGMRYTLLGGQSVPWHLLIPSFISASAFLLGGIWFFQRRERLMADKV